MFENDIEPDLLIFLPSFHGILDCIDSSDKKLNKMKRKPRLFIIVYLIDKTIRERGNYYE